MNEIEAYIRNSALRHGVDPDTAVAVARSEGGLNSWNRQSDVVKNGVREQSYGPFQLYTQGGLGNQFMKQTGMDPSQASAGPAGVDFAMQQAAKNGWGAWYGAQKIGVTGMEGINGNPVNVQPLTPEISTAASGIGALPTVSEVTQDTVKQAAVTTQADPVSGIFNMLLQQRMQQPQQVPEEPMVRQVDNRTVGEKVAATSQTPNVYLDDLKRRYL